MIRNVLKNKTFVLLLIILALLLSNISINHRYQQLSSKEAARMYTHGSKQMVAIMSDFSLFSGAFIIGASTRNFFYPNSPIDAHERYVSIHSVYTQARSLDLKSFSYLYESMLNVYELYYQGLINIKELEYLIISLNKDVRELVDLYSPFSEESTYKKANGLDPTFAKKEKEFMDKVVEKYQNISGEDINNRRSR